ncbi:tetratricopeptide repeat protein, partial [Candidatus Riflebacteria bacterium]
MFARNSHYILLFCCLFLPCTTIWATGERKERTSILLNEGEKLFHSGELQKAKENLRKLVILDPEIFAAHFRLGLIAIRENEFDRAINYLEKAKALKETGEIYYLLGLAHLKAGDLPQALKIFKKGSQIFPNFQGNYRALD